MNSLNWERAKPIALAIVVTIVWRALPLSFPKDLGTFLSASLSFAAILVGFAVTIQTVLVTVSGADVIGRIKKSGYMEDLDSYLKHATYSLLLFSLMNLVGFLLPTAAAFWFELIWVFLCVYALAAFFRVSEIISKILKAA